MEHSENAPGGSAKAPLHLAIVARMKGPGGYYNIGNLLGLVAGTAVQIMHAAGDGPIGFSQSARVTVEQFVGSPSAVALSVAMFVFFLSGEAYHRAWENGFPPIEALNRRGDWLSGIGAIFLGVGLLITGQPFLAATAGLLHAVGKFGSAWAGTPDRGIWPAAWPDLWRTLVLASRVPALLAATLSLTSNILGTSAKADIITPVTLLLCYILWIKADLMLFRSKA